MRSWWDFGQGIRGKRRKEGKGREGKGGEGRGREGKGGQKE